MQGWVEVELAMYQRLAGRGMSRHPVKLDISNRTFLAFAVQALIAAVEDMPPD